MPFYKTKDYGFMTGYDPFLIVEREKINKIRDIDSLGVYIYILSALTHKKRISSYELSEHFNTTEEQCIQHCDYLVDLKLLKEV